MAQEQIPPRLGLGVVIALIAYMFFITASSLVWNFKDRFPTVEIIFIQNLVSFLCIFPIASRFGVRRLKSKVMTIQVIRSIMGVVSYYLYFLAIRFLNLVDATTLNYTAPFFVPFIWWIWMQNEIPLNVWWTIIIGFFGVAVILNPTKEIFQLGFVFGIFAGLCSAIALCGVRVLNLKGEPMSRNLFYYFLIGAILSFPFAAAVWVAPHGIDWFLCISIGIATAIGQVLLTIAYRYGTAAYLSPLGYSTVIYAIFISWILFDKAPTWRSLIGTILIIVGGSLTYFFKKKAPTIKKTFTSPNPKQKPPPL